MPRSTNLQNQSPDQMIEVPTELEGENSDIIWSGGASSCCKKLKHYPAFCRSGTTIPDYRNQKMVKVRWFHRTDEVSGLISEPRPHEIIITPHFQVVSAECVDGLATVLTPKHYEHCLAVLSEDFSDGIYMCSRQIKKNKITPFPLSKLRGYSSQTIFSVLDLSIGPNKLKPQITSREEKKEVEQPTDPKMKIKLSSKGLDGQSSRGVLKITNSVSDNQVEKTQPTDPKMKIKLSSGGLDGQSPIGVLKIYNSISDNKVEKTQPTDPKSKIKLSSKGLDGTSEPHHEIPSFSVGEEIEVSEKVLKVLYMDVEDVEGSGNLEEWVLAYRLAVPDKLGMRCLGRHTIRPFPAKNSSNGSFSIGAPVDAWWCDGWWEGVVVATNIRGKNPFHVYFPGENKFQNFENEKLRTSKDWVDNIWVELNPKPDVLNFISSNVKSNMKLQRCITLGGSSGSGNGLSSVDHKVVASIETEAAEKKGKELPALKKLKGVVLKKKKAYV
ncbi:Bromo adjacent homology (BAH) domain-containing protein, partial [Cynara cardunculus var. scolymus]